MYMAIKHYVACYVVGSVQNACTEYATLVTWLHQGKVLIA